MVQSTNSNAVAIVSDEPRSLSVFSSESSFESAQRMAKALAASDLVPPAFKGNLANCLLALEVASRTGASIMAVTQNLHIIHGRPSWSSTYIIAALNSCGRFAPLRFKVEVTEKDKICTAWTVDKSGEILEGPPVSISMAKSEGWFDKSGSKWKTMPDLMLRYRAAAFFGRLYAPDVLFGMQSEDEILDVKNEAKPKLEGLNARIRASRELKAPPIEIEAVAHEVDAIGEESGVSDETTKEFF